MSRIDEELDRVDAVKDSALRRVVLPVICLVMLLVCAFEVGLQFGINRGLELAERREVLNRD